MPLTALLARAAALGYTILVQIAQWTASLPGAVFQTASLWRAVCGIGLLRRRDSAGLPAGAAGSTAA